MTSVLTGTTLAATVPESASITSAPNRNREVV